MGGVDLMDSFLGRYRVHMKTRKWYLRIFYHLLDITIINAWVLYLKVNKQKGVNPKSLMDLGEFRSDLAETLTKYGTHRVREEDQAQVWKKLFVKRKGQLTYLLCLPKTFDLIELATSL